MTPQSTVIAAASHPPDPDLPEPILPDQPGEDPAPDTYPDPMPDPDPQPTRDPDLPRPGEVVPPVRGAVR